MTIVIYSFLLFIQFVGLFVLSIQVGLG